MNGGQVSECVLVIGDEDITQLSYMCKTNKAPKWAYRRGKYFPIPLGVGESSREILQALLRLDGCAVARDVARELGKAASEWDSVSRRLNSLWRKGMLERDETGWTGAGTKGIQYWYSVPGEVMAKADELSPDPTTIAAPNRGSGR